MSNKKPDFEELFEQLVTIGIKEGPGVPAAVPKGPEPVRVGTYPGVASGGMWAISQPIASMSVVTVTSALVPNPPTINGQHEFPIVRVWPCDTLVFSRRQKKFMATAVCPHCGAEDVFDDWDIRTTRAIKECQKDPRKYFMATFDKKRILNYYVSANFLTQKDADALLEEVDE